MKEVIHVRSSIPIQISTVDLPCLPPDSVAVIVVDRKTNELIANIFVQGNPPLVVALNAQTHQQSVTFFPNWEEYTGTLTLMPATATTAGILAGAGALAHNTIGDNEAAYLATWQLASSTPMPQSGR